MNYFPSILKRRAVAEKQQPRFRPIAKRKPKTTYHDNQQYVLPDEMTVVVESPEFYSQLAYARLAVERAGGYVERRSTYILRVGESTIQLWDQIDDTHGQDGHVWMQVRGPAFDDRDLFPVESYRMCRNAVREAVQALCSHG